MQRTAKGHRDQWSEVGATVKDQEVGKQELTSISLDCMSTFVDLWDYQTQASREWETGYRTVAQWLVHSREKQAAPIFQESLFQVFAMALATFHSTYGGLPYRRSLWISSLPRKGQDGQDALTEVVYLIRFCFFALCSAFPGQPQCSKNRSFNKIMPWLSRATATFQSPSRSTPYPRSQFFAFSRETSAIVMCKFSVVDFSRK